MFSSGKKRNRIRRLEIEWNSTQWFCPAYLGRRLVRPDTKTRRSYLSRSTTIVRQWSLPRPYRDRHSGKRNANSARREHVRDIIRPRQNVLERTIRSSFRRVVVLRHDRVHRGESARRLSLHIPEFACRRPGSTRLLFSIVVACESRDRGETRDTEVALRKRKPYRTGSGSCSGSESKASEALLCAVSGAARRPISLALSLTLSLSFSLSRLSAHFPIPGESIAVRKEDRADL